MTPAEISFRSLLEWPRNIESRTNLKWKKEKITQIMNEYDIKSSFKSRMREGYLNDSWLEVPGKTMQTDRQTLKKE